VYSRKNEASEWHDTFKDFVLLLGISSGALSSAFMILPGPKKGSSGFFCLLIRYTARGIKK
jgi:hypothetical protein